MKKHTRLYKTEQAEALAEILVNAAFDKVVDKKKKTPYQRKYKKTYNATWEVSILTINISYRVVKKMILHV